MAGRCAWELKTQFQMLGREALNGFPLRNAAVWGITEVGSARREAIPAMTHTRDDEGLKWGSTEGMEKEGGVERGGEHSPDRMTHFDGSRKDLDMLFEVSLENKRMSQVFCESRKQAGWRKWRMWVEHSTWAPSWLENPSLPESQVAFREVAGYRRAVEQGRKSRSKGFITSPKVWNEGSTPDEELERNLKKRKISHWCTSSCGPHEIGICSSNWKEARVLWISLCFVWDWLVNSQSAENGQDPLLLSPIKGRVSGLLHCWITRC